MSEGPRILVGGTFSGLHAGHRKLLETAFTLGGRVLVCLTSGSMAKGKHIAERIGSYAERKVRLEGFLRDNGWRSRAEIVMITDPFSEGMRESLESIVVSKETRGNAEKINAMRKEKGLRQMEIVEVPWVMADDGRPISGERIRKGEIGEDGSLPQ